MGPLSGEGAGLTSSPAPEVSKMMVALMAEQRQHEQARKLPATEKA